MRKIASVSTAYLEDISQAFFFRNAYFGGLLLILLGAFDRYFFVCAVLASLIGYVYTLIYSTPKLVKDSGLITINGFFFGTAVASLFQESPSLYACLVFGALSIPIMTKAAFEVLQHWKLSPYVFPYILSVWVLWLCGNGMALEMRHDIWPEVIATLPPIHPEWSYTPRLVFSAFQGAGRLLFLPDVRFGLSILALISVFSPRRGLFFFLGTAVGSYLALLMAGESSAWEYGFFSYCGGLVGLALASSPEKFNWRTILLLSVLTCFLTIATDQFLRGMNLPVLSLPYVLSMWIAVLSRVPRVSMSWAQSKPAPDRPTKVREEELKKVA